MKTIENDLIQAARWFVSLTGNTEEDTEEYKLLQKAVCNYNHVNWQEETKKPTLVEVKQ